MSDAAISIRRIAVIGAGRLGRTLADLCRDAGYSIILEDVLPSRLRGAAGEFDELAPTSPAAGPILDLPFSRSADADAERPLSAGTVEYAATIEEAVRHADLVIDCVPDELESKLEIFSLVDRMAPPRTILATPTRSLSIADLASCTYRPERCVSLHWPAGMLDKDMYCEPCDLLILHTAGTDGEVLKAVVAFWGSIGFRATLKVESL